MNDGQEITLAMISKRWGIAPRTVTKWVQLGMLKPSAGTDRESWRFSAAELNAFHTRYGFSFVFQPQFEDQENAKTKND